MSKTYGRLAAKVALITGATSGIGKATAAVFAQEGAQVVFTGRRAALGETVASEIISNGGEATFMVADHTQPDDCRRVVDQVVSMFGQLDILFNNAGIVIRGSAEDITDDEWQLTFDLNVTALWRMSTLVLPVMRAQGGGAIINNASHWGLVAEKNAVAYCASKGAVIQITRAMALDHARENIRINAVCPGDILVEKRLEPGGDLVGIFREDLPAAMKNVGDYLPIGRIAYAEEIARSVLFLASDDASYITGTTLLVDGGNTAR